MEQFQEKLFGDIWPNISSNEAPITYVTNGIHTCSWLPQNIKALYNEYLAPYWQDNIFNDETWQRINIFQMKNYGMYTWKERENLLI